MSTVKLISQVLANDSGLDAKDGITNDGAVTLKGTVAGASSVMIYDKSVQLGLATVASDGTWTFNGRLGEGYHTLYAATLDKTGKATAYSALGQSIVVETQAPEITMSSQKLMNDTGAADRISSDGRVEIRGTVSEFYSGPLGTPGTLVAIYDGATKLGNATVYTDNTWLFSGTLSAGTHSLRAVATDYAGNSVSSSAGAPIVITSTATASGTAPTSANPVSGVVKTLRADGATVLQTFSGGKLTQELVNFLPGGTELSETKLIKDGVTIRDTVVHADKSKDITYNAIAGRSYTSEHDTFDSSGTLTAMTRTRADHTLVSTYALAADGTKVTKQFDAQENITASTTVQADGTSTSKTFSGDQLTVQAVTYAAGSPDISDTKRYTAGTLSSETIVHADHRSDRFVYSATGQVTTHDRVGADGKLAFRDVTNADASHSISVYGSGNVVTSTSKVADVISNAAVGGTTFVYKPSSGHDIINGFHAGAGAAHDVIQVDKSIATDFAGLKSMMSGSGTNTTIGLTANDSILLKNVALSTLSAQNFSFG